MGFSPTVMFLGIKVFPFGAVNSDLYATQGPLFGPRVLLPRVIAYGDQPTRLKLTVFSQQLCFSRLMCLSRLVCLRWVKPGSASGTYLDSVFGFHTWILKIPYLGLPLVVKALPLGCVKPNSISGPYLDSVFGSHIWIPCLRS